MRQYEVSSEMLRWSRRVAPVLDDVLKPSGCPPTLRARRSGGGPYDENPEAEGMRGRQLPVSTGHVD